MLRKTTRYIQYLTTCIMPVHWKSLLNVKLCPHWITPNCSTKFSFYGKEDETFEIAFQKFNVNFHSLRLWFWNVNGKTKRNAKTLSKVELCHILVWRQFLCQYYKIFCQNHELAESSYRVSFWESLSIFQRRMGNCFATLFFSPFTPPFLCLALEMNKSNENQGTKTIKVACTEKNEFVNITAPFNKWTTQWFNRFLSVITILYII